MKKMLSVLTIMLFCCLSMSAQQHIKFMGIPVDGHINAFSQKLIAKGFEPVPQTSSDNLWKEFYGTFAGEHCQLAVWYSRSGKVYCVSVGFTCDEENEALQKQAQYDRSLTAKYNSVMRPVPHFMSRHTMKVPGGCIDTDVDIFSFTIYYQDAINEAKARRESLNDL